LFCTLLAIGWLRHGTAAGSEWHSPVEERDATFVAQSKAVKLTEMYET
jgi:hypothetical protein